MLVAGRCRLIEGRCKMLPIFSGLGSSVFYLHGHVMVYSNFDSLKGDSLYTLQG